MPAKRGKAILLLSISALMVLNSVCAAVYLAPPSNVKVRVNSSVNTVSIDNGIIRFYVDASGEATILEHDRKDLMGKGGKFYLSMEE